MTLHEYEYTIVIINIINKFIDLVTLKLLYLFGPTKCPKSIEMN